MTTQTAQAEAHGDLVRARNSVMSAIVKMRGGHAAAVDECDRAMAGLDVAITRLLALLPVEDTPQGFTRSELHLIESACANRANDRVYAVNVPELQADKAELVRVSEKAGRLAKATPEASRRPK